MADTPYRSFTPFFLTSVFQWPRRTLARHIGFPGRAHEDYVCRRAPAAASPSLRNQAATHFLVRLLLQWLCHAPSIPCRTVICAATRLAGPGLSSHLIRIRHARGSPSNAVRKDLPVCRTGCSLLRTTSGRALRRSPVKYADASGHEAPLAAAAQCVASLRHADSTARHPLHDNRYAICYCYVGFRT
ncbi:hypothetical protein P3T25_001014 [Paraburkholderia sp. GAS32]